MEKIISMTSFVLEIINKGSETGDVWTPEYKLELIENYATFLKQPLTLGMFVPVEAHGKPYDLNEVESWNNHDYYSRYYKEELAFFNEAKEKVLFDRFEIESLNTVFNSDLRLTIYLDTYQFSIEDSLGIGGGDLYGNTLEALAHADLDIKLTHSALKQNNDNKRIKKAN
jgi:hypothetical protein